MNVTSQWEDSPWLLLVFTLPSSKASERVGIWRKLQKFGSIPLRNAGYVLPNNPVNQERFEWLATAIRSFKGEASILQIQAIDDLPPRVLQEQFRQARATDYEALIEEANLKPAAGTSGPTQSRGLEDAEIHANKTRLLGRRPCDERTCQLTAS